MKLLVDSENDLLLSPATYWELAIKISIGKYRLTDPLADYINEAIRLYGLKILPITPKHAEANVQLPHHHKDPFDRLLIAQAGLEALTIVTADPAFRRYEVTVIDASR